MSDHLLSSYDYELPPELVAQRPAERRDGSRLLVYDRAADAVRHARFSDLPDLLSAGDTLVLNRTRVRPSRLFGRRRDTGGRAEVLLLEPLQGERWGGLVRCGGRLVPGTVLELAEGALEVELIEDRGRAGWVLAARPRGGRDLDALLDDRGRMPLPPYIRRDRDDAEAAADRERYQTVFGDRPGAVAAPTAGLHLTPELLAALESRGVELARVLLHVGIGTFLPVEVEDVRTHRMHEEAFEVDAAAAELWRRTRARRGRVVAVGTTSVRALESAFEDEAAAVVARRGRTDVFLHPPHRPRAVDALITNFHLPRSTLLMLVSCFVGRERLLALYAEAVRERYRFFSYGDAMLIL